MCTCTHKRKCGRKPNADCWSCWQAYLQECPNAIITATTLRRIFWAMGINVIQLQIQEPWRKDY